jgi:DNA-binding transcriptional ArsR family regulator
MAKEKFLLVSLNESKSKQLAQAISNDSCRKILDYLADKEGTESELASKLNIPISTVHYNLQQLIKGGLVVVEEYHYSEKGKEINHYKLANKYIIIAPKSTYGIKEKLKSVLPVAILAGIGAGLIQFFSKIGGSAKTFGVESVARDIAPLAEKAMAESAPMAAELVNEVAPVLIDNATTNSLFISNIAVWFFIGAISSILLYLLVDYLMSKKK